MARILKNVYTIIHFLIINFLLLFHVLNVRRQTEPPGPLIPCEFDYDCPLIDCIRTSDSRCINGNCHCRE
ncbi:putative Late nodulin [Medicago truncatula]|uniref:Late nodulin n=1 Tax=Medicago truncatula TaxID=3880 RepID=A0A072UPM7_MEDTR|nr:late nodulin [Medicago truncatula]RHN62351.1 putative Late nodulin [Medicago truncatula]